MTLFLVVVMLTLVIGGLCAAAVYCSPVVRNLQERQRVEQEARFAQWRLQQVTSAAMRRLLDEARRQQS